MPSMAHVPHVDNNCLRARDQVSNSCKTIGKLKTYTF